MQVLYERCAGIDVGKDVIAVTVRRPGDGPGGRVTEKRMRKTFCGVLAEAARWLVSQGVARVAMEATGICSMPVCHALIEHGGFEQVLVCNAGHVKNVPGRKTAEVKAVRDVVRYRAKIAQQRVSEIARLGTCCRTPGSRSTRSPGLSRRSRGGR